MNRNQKYNFTDDQLKMNVENFADLFSGHTDDDAICKELFYKLMKPFTAEKYEVNNSDQKINLIRVQMNKRHIKLSGTICHYSRIDDTRYGFTFNVKNDHMKRMDRLFMETNYNKECKSRLLETIYYPKDKYDGDLLINRIYRSYDYYAKLVVNINSGGDLIKKINKTDWNKIDRYVTGKFAYSISNNEYEWLRESQLLYGIDVIKNVFDRYGLVDSRAIKACGKLEEYINELQDEGILPFNVLTNTYFAAFLDGYTTIKGYKLIIFKDKEWYKYIAYMAILEFIYTNSFEVDGKHYYEAFRTHSRYELEVADLGEVFEGDDSKVPAELKNACSKKKWMGLGQLTFVDEKIEDDIGLAKARAADPESNKLDTYSESIECPPDPNRDYLKELFENYKESVVTIHNVGNGNFIDLLISYSNTAEKKRLILDAGYQFNPKYIKSNLNQYDAVRDRKTYASDLRSLIIDKMVDEANEIETYVIVTHSHSDHYALLNEDSEIKIHPKIKWIFFGYSKGTCPVKKTLIAKAKERCMVLSDTPGKCLYESDNVKVFVGNKVDDCGNATERITWNENSQSIMIQLKQTLLPADCSYRYWPIGFGDSSYIHIVAPHHGSIPEPKKNDYLKFEKDKVNQAFDENTILYASHIYTNTQNDVMDCLKNLNIFGSDNPIIQDEKHIKGTWEKSKEYNQLEPNKHDVFYEKLYFFDNILLGKIYHTRQKEKMSGDDKDKLIQLRITGDTESAKIIDAQTLKSQEIRCLFELDEKLDFYAETVDEDSIDEDAPDEKTIDVWVLKHRDDFQSYENEEFKEDMPDFVAHFELSKPERIDERWNKSDFFLDSNDTEEGFYDFVFRFDDKTDSIMEVKFYPKGELSQMLKEEIIEEYSLLSGKTNPNNKTSED